MNSLQDKINMIKPLLDMIDKEGIDNTIKFLRILMPYTLKDYMKIVFEIQEELKNGAR